MSGSALTARRRSSPLAPFLREGGTKFTPSVVTFAEPQSRAAEAVRALRTHMMAQHVQEGRRALAVVGASEGVGCTFVAVNLAASLSQIGIKTLIIDADLRNPEVDKLLPAGDAGEGLRQCLSSPDAPFYEHIRDDVLPGLSALYSGGAAPNPQELLAGDRFRALIDFCLRDYDATIIDTPPANSCSDARRVSTVVGYSLVVAAKDRSYVDDVKILISQLKGDRARVIGTVLNQA
ncbi:MAG: CpsD/CapB family tyrosine-protein kinase [Caulobacteraceae bacterium]